MEAISFNPAPAINETHSTASRSWICTAVSPYPVWCILYDPAPLKGEGSQITGVLKDASAFAPAIVPAQFRLDASNGIQLFNPDTGSWHTLAVRGQAGQQTLEISPAIP